MQLYMLDKNPIVCAEKLPQKFRFKMLLELAQMVSTVTGCGTYKPIPQGKEIQQFIKNYPDWTCNYFNRLFELVKANTKLKEKTHNDFTKIYAELKCKTIDDSEPTYAPFRYSEKYKCNTPSKSVISIDKCIEEYNKYLAWKLTN